MYCSRQSEQVVCPWLQLQLRLSPAMSKQMRQGVSGVAAAAVSTVIALMSPLALRSAAIVVEGFGVWMDLYGC